MCLLIEKDSDLSVWTRSSENIAQREKDACGLQLSQAQKKGKMWQLGKSRIRHRHMETNILPPRCFFVGDYRTQNIKQLIKDLVRDDNTSPASQHCWKDGSIFVTCQTWQCFMYCATTKCSERENELSPTQSMHVLSNSRSRHSPRGYFIIK